MKSREISWLWSPFRYLISDNFSINQETPEPHNPFPFNADEDFKLAIGITNHEFIVSINGEHFVKAVNNDTSFFGSPVNFEVVPSDGLNLDITGVDVFVMKKEQDMNELSKKSDPEKDRLLAQIYNH